MAQGVQKLSRGQEAYSAGAPETQGAEALAGGDRRVPPRRDPPRSLFQVGQP